MRFSTLAFLANAVRAASAPAPAPAPSAGPATWISVVTVEGEVNPTTGLVATKPASTASTDLLVAEIINVESTKPIVTPAGWTFAGNRFLTFGDLGAVYFTAPGDVSALAFLTSTGTSLGISISLHRFSGANLAAPIRSITWLRDTDFIDAANMPSPSGAASAGDAVLAMLFHPQSNGAMGTPTAGYTRVVDLSTLNRRSTLQQSNMAAGATGDISHNAGGRYEARLSATLVIAAA